MRLIVNDADVKLIDIINTSYSCTIDKPSINVIRQTNKVQYYCLLTVVVIRSTQPYVSPGSVKDKRVNEDQLWLERQK